MVPYRAGDHKLADEYEALLRNSRGLSCVAIDAAVLRGAALLRARTGARTPDAIQLATALQRDCAAFITNDRNLPSLGRLKVLQLDDWA